MRTVATLFTLALIAGFACAQGDDSMKISGTVFEMGGDGASLRVSGATVTISVAESREVVGTTFTDSNGAFEFHPSNPGDYVVEVKKDGYSMQGVAATPVAVGPGRPQMQLPFYLARPGELTGRVVDEDRAPVADLEVIVQRKSAPGGMKVITGKDGVFTASDLPPTTYVARISPPPDSREKLVTDFSEDDLKIVDHALETSYWPGGTTEPSATVSVNPGGSANIGTIKVHQVNYYRAHISVKTGDCAPGETWEFSLLTANPPGGGPQANATLRFSADLPCAKDFLVSNLAAGSYWFELREVEPDPERWGLASVDISQKNLDVALGLEPETEVIGRVVAADGATLPPLDSVRVTTGFVGLGNSSGSPLADVDAEGKFTLKLKFPRHQIEVVGLTKQYYVKGYRFNGAPSDGSITVNPGVGTLEIVIDDQPGSITGVVTDGDKPATRTVVMLFTESLQRAQTSVIVDKQGGFQFAGLVPGEYRVVALPMVARLQNESADAIAQLAARGATVKVERGGTANVSLKLIDPSR